MNESYVLAEVSNENQTLVAVVQQGSRAAYFYIYPAEAYSDRYQVRACWLRNPPPRRCRRIAPRWNKGSRRCWRRSIAATRKAKRR